MIKATIDEKKKKIKVLLKGEGLDIINEGITLFSAITADVLNRVYQGDLNQMFQELDHVIEVMKSNCEQRMAYKVEKGGK